MTKPPNHRETSRFRCDTCKDALWTEGPHRVYMCKKHNCWTEDSKLCDDWEAEQ